MSGEKTAHLLAVKKLPLVTVVELTLDSKNEVVITPAFLEAGAAAINHMRLTGKEVRIICYCRELEFFNGLLVKTHLAKLLSIVGQICNVELITAKENGYFVILLKQL